MRILAKNGARPGPPGGTREPYMGMIIVNDNAHGKYPRPDSAINQHVRVRESCI